MSHDTDHKDKDADEQDVTGFELHPPLSFGRVAPGLFRSNMPAMENIAFMETLKLRTMVLLAPQKPPKHVAQFLAENKIELVHIGVDAIQLDWKPMSEENVKEALEIMLDGTRHPLLVVSSPGMQQTGAVVGVLRKLQQWLLSAILDEYRRYAGVSARYFTEQFIEVFDTDLVTVPSTAPQWFIQWTTDDDDGDSVQSNLENKVGGDRADAGLYDDVFSVTSSRQMSVQRSP